MSEFIVIQVGQCGNQIGGSLWPSILKEYNIEISTNNLDKTMKKTNKLSPHQSDLQQSFSSFFEMQTENKQSTFRNLYDLKKNRVKARVICIDMEDSVVSRFTNCPLKNIFSKKGIVTSYPGSGNNWAEGYYCHGPTFKDQILKAVTHYVEVCDSLHGFLLLYSMGGGTGSGLGSYVLELLADHFPSIERFVACVYSTGTEDVVTSPYNMMLATQELIKHATCVFPIENRALLDITERNEGVGQTERYMSIKSTFKDVNSIIVNMLLHLTSGSRFSGKLNFDMNEINTNMVPFPKLNFLCSGYSPTFVPGNLLKKSSRIVKDEIFMNSCNRNHQLIKIEPLGLKSVLLGATFVGRGDYTLADMRSYLDKLRRKAHFTSWSSKSVKLGLCDVPQTGSDRSMLSLFNTSSITNLFHYIEEQYQKLFRRKAHVHHYTNIPAFDFDYFYECQSSINEIIDLYDEVENMSPANIPRLTPALISGEM